MHSLQPRRAVVALERAHLEARGQRGALEVLLVDLAAREEAQRPVDAAHVQAVGLDPLEALAQDALVERRPMSTTRRRWLALGEIGGPHPGRSGAPPPGRR